MLRWALIFLAVALVAGIFGFGGIAAFSVDIAQLIFFVAIVLFLVALVANLVSGKRPPRIH